MRVGWHFGGIGATKHIKLNEHKAFGTKMGDLRPSGLVSITLFIRNETRVFVDRP